jgi:hypothetical protein
MAGNMGLGTRRGAVEAPAHASVGQNRDSLDLDEERSGQLDPD